MSEPAQLGVVHADEAAGGIDRVVAARGAVVEVAEFVRDALEFGGSLLDAKLQLVAGLTHGLFGKLAVGDVDVDASDAGRAAVFSEGDAALIDDPAHAAGGMDDAILDAELGPLSGHFGAGLVLDARAVVRVNHGQPGLVGRFDDSRVAAAKAEILLGPVDVAGSEVEVPQAGLG